MKTPIAPVVAPKTIEDRLRALIVEQIGVDADTVLSGAIFVDDLGADSLDCVELLLEVEEEFDIDIPDDEADKIRTFGQAVAYVTGRTSQTV